jgi:purine nucleosidase/pyrimidine-specific ribonucleoside hydrolase
MVAPPLILDVDTGVDDAVAIALALSKGANLIGISTVAGNVPVNVATRNTLDVLAAFGRSDVPVHRGASRALVLPHQAATDVHGGNGLGGVRLRESEAQPAALAGPAFIIESAAKHDGKLVLVMLGPLTNLAIALNVRPEIVRQVRAVVVMGGAYFVPGNVTPQAEFNVFADPHAAQQVFDADWKQLTLVGLDVTHQTVLSREAWSLIPKDAEGAAGFVRAIMERTFTERDKSGFYLHDPLAVAVALDPTLVSGIPRLVTVLTDDAHRGKTMALEGMSKAVVATAVDAERFVAGMSETLGLPVVGRHIGLERAE